MLWLVGILVVAGLMSRNQPRLIDLDGEIAASFVCVMDDRMIFSTIAKETVIHRMILADGSRVKLRRIVRARYGDHIAVSLNERKGYLLEV